MAEELPITADTKFADVVASVPEDVAKTFWKKRNAVSNFLKHADRDAGHHISLDDVDNLQLLTQAYSAYVDLVHDDLEAEGLVLWIYHSVANGIIEGLPPQYQDITERLQTLREEERLKLCSMFIDELNERT